VKRGVKICLQEKKEKDIKWRFTNAKRKEEQIATRKNCVSL